jgi:hypothetical protein
MAQRKWEAAQDASYRAVLSNAEGRIDNVIPASKGLVPGCSRVHGAAQMDSDSSRIIQRGRQVAAPEM